MICLMDDRISSIDGSLVAGLFIKASFDTRRAQFRKNALDSSPFTLCRYGDFCDANPWPAAVFPRLCRFFGRDRLAIA
jgi:hypothetical protein